MKQNLLGTSLVVGLALAVVAGCGKKDDPIAKAEKKDADKPGIVAIKDIAQEAYIYGVPDGHELRRHARLLHRS